MLEWNEHGSVERGGGRGHGISALQTLEGCGSGRGGVGSDCCVVEGRLQRGRGKVRPWPLGKAMEVVREGPTLNRL